MARNVLRDKNLNILGYVDTDSNGKQTLMDKNFNIKGYYSPIENLTRDRNLNIIGRGNILTTLLL